MTQLPISEPAARPACFDCPARRAEAFDALLTGGCDFQCRNLDGRAALPELWFDTYRFAMVRRGVLIRQRIDAQGGVVAIDVAGPGCAFHLEDRARSASGSVPTGYAATDVLVCLTPTSVLDHAVHFRQGVAEDLIRMQSEMLERIERLADARGRERSDGKVAALLCTLMDTLTPPLKRDQIPAGLHQRDLSQLLGMRHETFCRILGRLEQRGAVQRQQDGLRILDRRLLESS